jgi:hypothetical protein
MSEESTMSVGDRKKGYETYQTVSRVTKPEKAQKR